MALLALFWTHIQASFRLHENRALEGGDTGKQVPTALLFAVVGTPENRNDWQVASSDSRLTCYRMNAAYVL